MPRLLDNPQFSGLVQFTTGTFTAEAGTTVDLAASTLKLPANCLTAAMLPLMVGDSAGTGGTKGAVPPPPAGSAAAGMYLAASGQWAIPTVCLPANVALVLSPMTTAGDMIVGGVNGATTRLPAGTAGQFLAMGNGGPAWVAAPSSGGGGSGIVDAPSDGNLYGRENGGWVAVAGGAGGSAQNIAITNYYANSYDQPPATGNQWDDEFLGTTINGKWTLSSDAPSSIGTSLFAVQNNSLCLKDVAGGSQTQHLRLLQGRSSGAFTLLTRVEQGYGFGNYNRGCLVLNNSTSNASLVFGLNAGNNISLTQYTGASEGSTLLNAPQPINGLCYLQIAFDGNDTLTFSCGQRGLDLAQVYQTSVSGFLGAGFDQFGILYRPYGVKSSAVFRFFRVTQP